MTVWIVGILKYRLDLNPNRKSILLDQTAIDASGSFIRGLNLNYCRRTLSI